MIGGRGGNFSGSGSGGGGNNAGPLLTDHLRDLDMQLELLKRKRQIYQKEQQMLNRLNSNFSSRYSDEYSSNHYHTNNRQYGNKQPFNTYNQQGPSEQYSSSVDYSNAYEPGPGPSSNRSQGIKRQQVWENQYSSPPKRFNAHQRVNPWQNQDSSQEYRPVYQSQPKNNSTKSRSFMNPKPGISQRINNKYNPPVERKNFKPSKVNKPNFNPVKKTPIYRPSEETKKLLEETNKLIHTSKIAGSQNPVPKGSNPPQKKQNPPQKKQTPPQKKQNPPQQIPNPSPKAAKKKIESDNILRPNRQPVGQMKGRLELALGMIVKSIKELCPDASTLEYFMLPFIQRVIKYTIRIRIKNVMMNEPIVSVTEVVDKYRKKYPKETDFELMKIAKDADEYSRKNRGFLQLIEADDPEEFFRKNFNKLLYNKLEDLFKDLKDMTAKREYNIEECVENFTKQFDKLASQENEGQVNEKGGKSTEGEKDIQIKNDTNGNKDMEGVNELTGGKSTEGEEKINVKKDTNENKDMEGVNEITGEKSTDGEENIEIKKDTNRNKDMEGVIELNEEKGKPKSKPLKDEFYSLDEKNVMEQLQVKLERTKHYVDFMDRLIEQRLPQILPRFKENIMAVLCSNKEFLCTKALIVLEMKEKLRKTSEENTITLDDETTSGSTNTASATKTAAATGSSGVTIAAKSATAPAKPKTAAAKPATPTKTPVKPAATAAANKPAVTAATDKLGATTATDKPGATTATDKPGATTATDKPGATTATDKPGTTTAADKPGTTTAADKPAATIATDKPGATAATDKPTATAAADKPTVTVVADKPSATTAIDKPTVTVAADKQAIKPATTTSSIPTTPVKEAGKSVPSTPSTPASNDIYFVKLIGSPSLPARAVIYEFLNTFKPVTIKKHKSIKNLLVIGFTDKEGYDKILAANESVVGDATIYIKASEQVINTPVQNKTGQQGYETPETNKATDEDKTPQNGTEEQKNADAPNKEDIKTSVSKDATMETTTAKTTDDEVGLDQSNTSTEDILSELDTQITDLLSSIKKADEEENTDANAPRKSADVEKMITDTELDKEIAELTQESDDRKAALSKQQETTDAEEPAKTNNANEQKALQTIMEVDDEDKKGKAIEEVAKNVKESGRATPTRSSSRLANVTPSTIKTRRASRLANN